MYEKAVDCIAIILVMTVSGCANEHSDKMQLAESCINGELSLSCTVTDCDFQQNSAGITGGMFMYSFSCRGKDGGEFTASCRGCADLTAETVSRLTVSKGE